MSNIPQFIKDLIPKKLYLQDNHPIKIISDIISKDIFKDFELFDNLV